MKHLLIILSILLLSSPVIGQETGVLYQYETSSGFQWKTFGDGKVQPKYNGEIKNGIMDGLGVLTYPYDEKNIVGEWKEGKEWNTKHTKKDGTLLGKFENGEWKISWGVLYFGLRNGKYGWEEDGDEKKNSKYVGEVKYGIPYGQGTLTYLNGNKYVGEVKYGIPYGQGTYSFPNGDKYVGEWKDGKKHGYGTLTYLNGEKYVGEFKDGEKHGQGTYTFSDGRKYVGEYKDDKKHGQGTFIWSNGDKYVGEYKDGEENSQGTYTWSNGDKYVGEYKDGERHGQGTYTWSDGRKYVGEYKDGEPWNGTYDDKDGKIIFKYVNGVLQK